jgi:aminoglycoside 6'-N-acetyltransferase
MPRAEIQGSPDEGGEHSEPQGSLDQGKAHPQTQGGSDQVKEYLEVEGVQGGMILRPLAKGDEAELHRIHATPEVAYWWDLPVEGFPWTDEPDSVRLTIVLAGAVAGLIQFYEEPEPRYRHATIDLFLDPALHGRGLGTEAVRRLVRHLIDDRGHHRVTIDPSTGNTAAIRSYEKVGFRPVGVMRRYVHLESGWQDGLLMELLADEP